MTAMVNILSDSIQIGSPRSGAGSFVPEAHAEGRVVVLSHATTLYEESLKLVDKWRGLAEKSFDLDAKLEIVGSRFSQRTDRSQCVGIDLKYANGKDELWNLHAKKYVHARDPFSAKADDVAAVLAGAIADAGSEKLAREKLLTYVFRVNEIDLDVVSSNMKNDPVDNPSTSGEKNHLVSKRSDQEVEDPLRSQVGLSEMWEQWASYLDDHNKDLEYYRSALEVYSKYYQKIIDLTKVVQNALTANGAEKYTVDFQAIRSAMQAISANYSRNRISLDRIIAGREGMSGGKGLVYEEARSICEKLGLSPVCMVIINPSGNPVYYFIRPDLSNLDRMLETDLVKDGKKIDIDITRFNLWKSSFDAQTHRIQEAIEVLTQKTTRRFSQFDSAHNTISKMMEALLNMMQKFLQF